MFEDVLGPVAVLTGLALIVYAALDARATPAEVFGAVHRSRTAWMTLTLIGAFLIGVGIPIGGFQVLPVRPELRRESPCAGSRTRCRRASRWFAT